MSSLLYRPYEQSDTTSAIPQKPDERTSSTSVQSKVERHVRFVIEKYKTVIHRLISFLDLPENWNGHGSIAPSAKTCSQAVTLIFMWTLIAKQLGEELPLPFVAPCGDGSIQIEWSYGRKELEIEISHDSPYLLNWLAVLKTDTGYEEKSSAVLSTALGEQEVLIRWLVASE